MANSARALIAVKRRIQNASVNLRRLYRNSALRNRILAARAPQPANRFSADCKSFVVFLITGWDFVNGGIMSICSIAGETRRLLSANDVSVVVCTAYGQPRMLRLTKFENDIEIFAFEDLLKWFPTGSEVLVHVPDLRVSSFVCNHLHIYRTRPDLKWRFNILLQNIDRIPSNEAVACLQQLGPTTATINHKASTAAAKSLCCPIHYLSWIISAEDYQRVGYADKKNMIAISPDTHPAKKEIVGLMRKALPDHRVVEIRNMTYQRYKSIIRDAKFMFTFGEGLDGYFVESIFSGAVAMAIFEDRYFTSEYRSLPGIFQDSDTAISSVMTFLRDTNKSAAFPLIAERQINVVSGTFRRDLYQNNLREFYRKYFEQWSQEPVG
jgi:hypothetical protein